MSTVTRYATIALGVCILVIPERTCAQSAPMVSGRITDAATGAALGSVEVTLSGGVRTISAPDGSYRLRALEPGSAVLQARRPGFVSASRALTLENGQSVSVLLAMTPLPVTLGTQRVAAGSLPAGVSVIDRATIERAAARDLGELLRNQPGVTLVQRGGPGSPVTVSIRGSSANQVLLLLDGTPLNDAVSGDADLSRVDPAIIDHVDIVRGAQSARYGGQALGGVILVTTRRPASVAPQLVVGGGQWGDRRLGAQLGANTANDDRVLSASGAASWQQNRGDFTTAVPVERGGGTTRRLNADARRIAVSTGASAEHHGTTLDVRADLSDVERGMPGSIVQPSLAARQTQRRLGVTTTLSHAARSALALRTSVGVQRQSGHFADPAPPFGPAYDQRQRVTSVVGAFDAAGELHGLSLLAGVEARRLGVDGNALADSARRTVASGGLWAGVSRVFRAGDASVDIGGSARGDVGTLWRGAYLSPDVHMTLQRGVVRAGAAWRSAFAAPTLGDLFFQEGVQVRANPALRPERVQGEWTASFDIDRMTLAGLNTGFSVTGFRGDIDDLILWSPDFRFIWSPNNFDVTRRGIESAVHLALPSNAVALTLAGAGVDVRYRGPVLEGQVIYRPRLTGSAALHLTRGAYDAQLAVQRTTPRRTVVGSDINRLPAFQVVQARVARRLTLGPFDSRVRVSVENLLDQRIAMLLDYPQPGRTVALDVTLRPRARAGARPPPFAPRTSPSTRFEHR